MNAQMKKTCVELPTRLNILPNDYQDLLSMGSWSQGRWVLPTKVESSSSTFLSLLLLRGPKVIVFRRWENDQWFGAWCQQDAEVEAAGASTLGARPREPQQVSSTLERLEMLQMESANTMETVYRDSEIRISDMAAIELKFGPLLSCDVELFLQPGCSGSR